MGVNSRFIAEEGWQNRNSDAVIWPYILPLDVVDAMCHLYVKKKKKTSCPHLSIRNGNGLGSDRVFSYPNPTRRSIPETRTRPVY